MATLIVDEAGDATGAPGTTLREAIASASDTDTITFDPSLNGTTLTLSGQIAIDKDITIEGGNQITLTTNFNDRVFSIDGAHTVTLNGLSMTAVKAPAFSDGGALYIANGATVTINTSQIINASAENGGAIYVTNATLTMNASTITDSAAIGGIGDGGAIYASNATVGLQNVTLADNFAEDDGFAVYTFGSQFNLINTTVTENYGGAIVGGTGAGIKLVFGTLNLVSSIVIGNTEVSLDPGAPDTVSNIVNAGGTINDLGGNVLTSAPADVFAALGFYGGGALSDNGGPVQTVALKNSATNPALDVNTATATDARGLGRVDFDGVGFDGTSIADAGAYELQCFLAGTRIATPEGERPVEDLRPGDLVITADGRAAEVTWLWPRTACKADLPWARYAPVRVPAGALGDGLPHSDLYLTADHALILDGIMVNAGALLGYRGIGRVAPQALPDSLTYWHVETERHEALLANGAAAESFVDFAGRRGFDTFDAYIDLYGAERIIQEMPLPRVSARRLLPQALRDRLSPASGPDAVWRDTA